MMTLVLRGLSTTWGPHQKRSVLKRWALVLKPSWRPCRTTSMPPRVSGVRRSIASPLLGITIATLSHYHRHPKPPPLASAFGPSPLDTTAATSFHHHRHRLGAAFTAGHAPRRGWMNTHIVLTRMLSEDSRWMKTYDNKLAFVAQVT